MNNRRLFWWCRFLILSLLIAATTAETGGIGINDEEHRPLTNSYGENISGEGEPGSSLGAKDNQGRNAVEKVLNVHIVPHSHDDVGWLKTVEQYYHGWNNTIQKASVKNILDTVVAALKQNSRRTFTYVEQAFFAMWWKNQPLSVRDSVRKLVANKQLSFANGGWCMHDEATTHYMGMIDQTTLGHTFLKQELGFIPKVGWQLDPFGHSSTQASLLTSEIGFNALYFGRIDHQDLSKRYKTQECEGLWSSSPNLKDTTTFWGLSGSYLGNYNPPDGFCFDILCNDPTLLGLDDTQMKLRLNDFLGAIKLQSDRTKGSNIMLTMGSDFQYQSALKNYRNLDILIDSLMRFQSEGIMDISSKIGPRFDKINVFYSSPEKYTDYKHKETINTLETNEADKVAQSSISTIASPWSTKTDDFFPYSDCDHCFWTGYFTSRPGLKRLERVGSSFLHTSRQIEALADQNGHHYGLSKQRVSLEKEQQSSLQNLDEAMGIAQHHDAVSGTSKQHVAYDYAKKIQSGINDAEKYAAGKLRRMLQISDSTTNNPSNVALMDLSYFQLVNETICHVSQGATAKNGTDLYIVVYNALAFQRSELIRIPVSTGGAYRIWKLSAGVSINDEGLRTQTGAVVKSVVLPNHGSVEAANFVLNFDTGLIPPVGASVFRVSKAALDDIALKERTFPSGHPSIRKLDNGQIPSKEDFSISNGVLEVTFNGTTGTVKKVCSVDDRSMEIDILQEWGYYHSFHSNPLETVAQDASRFPDRNRQSSKRNTDAQGKSVSWSNPQQNSGAYIFRPKEPQEELNVVPLAGVEVYKSNLVTEIHAKSGKNPWVKQITRITSGRPYIEVEYTIGPVPIDDGVGKEVVTRFSTGIKSNATFHTDSNGREFLQRKRSFRPTWKLENFEPVAGNYYPVNAAIFIEDEHASFGVVTDRSQGGTSLSDGSIELMVQRRTIADDARGVDEPINETDEGMTPYPPFGNAKRLGKGVVTKGTHRLVFGPGKTGASIARSEMDRVFSSLQVFVGTAPTDKPLLFGKTSFSAIQRALPENVMLITFAKIASRPGTFLVRLGHQFGIGEDNQLSNPVRIDMGNLLKDAVVLALAEKTLSGNQSRSDWDKNKLRWTPRLTEDSDMNEFAGRASDDGFVIQLNPMEIRTFEVSVKRSSEMAQGITTSW